MPEVKYLVYVADNGNKGNNKFYKMTPKGNVFLAEWGRIDSSKRSQEYPISKFETKYREKLREGYVDQTHLLREAIEEVDTSPKVEYKPIPDKVVAEIVERLQSMARKTIESNYKVSSEAVTQAMIDEAQRCINTLVSADDVKEFNDILLKLFTVITRKMGSVGDFLAKNDSDFANIIDREQSLLDTMAGQVRQNAVQKKKRPKKKDTVVDTTILDIMGLEIRAVTAAEEKEIKKALGGSKNRYINAWRVANKKTQKAFDDFLEKHGKDKEVKRLWHGSRNENWWSILTTGLALRPTNAVITGKMFGYGIYFANEADKSMGYTSSYGSYWAGGTQKTGFLSLYDVIYGTPYIVDKPYHTYSGIGSLDYNKLRKLQPDADSLHAIAGKTSLRRDEIIVYKEEQATIAFLVEFS